jgi:hypothetical protein
MYILHYQRLLEYWSGDGLAGSAQEKPTCSGLGRARNIRPSACTHTIHLIRPRRPIRHSSVFSLGFPGELRISAAIASIARRMWGVVSPQWAHRSVNVCSRRAPRTLKEQETGSGTACDCWASSSSGSSCLCGLWNKITAPWCGLGITPHNRPQQAIESQQTNSQGGIALSYPSAPGLSRAFRTGLSCPAE